MKDLITEFNQLYKRFGDSKFWRLDGFRQANVEMFHLAQAIGTLYFPSIQSELDDFRRKVVKELAAQSLDGGKWAMSAAVMAPRGGHDARRQQMIWSDFQITPEISCDPNLTGRIVNRTLARGLIKSLKIQTAMVRKVAGI